ncbi:transmembrane protein 216 isoform X1 [Elephas maximus indicus]|uniref:transmembrane protein 216 isoform X1 n=1 Tax=Elephas maximus indicus TaxID=99487 RepID=UPI0021165815|nr:transmembrane protein 216 isoform X1 [Elephas maximus indicus]
MAPRGKRLSSTTLEILFFLNGWYYATYFLLELFIFLYKGLLLPYPTANLVLDVVMLLVYLGIEVIRLFFGSYMHPLEDDNGKNQLSQVEWC